jgi:RNA polymerase sigma-70 factor (ECF subfamily)
VIRGFARRLVGDPTAAEDLVHDTFVALLGAVRRFRGEASLRSFLLGVAVNHARRHVRAAVRRRRASENLASSNALLPAPPNASDALERKQLADRLSIALDELPIDQRVAFVRAKSSSGHRSRSRRSSARRKAPYVPG